MTRLARMVFGMVGAVAAASFLPLQFSRADDAPASLSPAKRLIKLGKKFDGAQSCGGSCHGKDGADSPPTEIGHELTIWSDADRHKESFKTLTENPLSKQIAAKVSIADAKTSDRCLECHALSVPAELKGQKYNLAEGNSCDQCHGPSEKWLPVHKQKGWTEQQRGKFDHDGLLKEWGLYDTKPYIARAEICVGCHLDIGSDLVAAGHPQPWFDLDYFTDIEPKHWLSEKETGYTITKIWASGQAVALSESMKQLAARATADKASPATKMAEQQAKAHLGVFKAAAAAMGIDTSGMALKPDSIAADATSISKLAMAAEDKVKAAAPDKKMTLKLLADVSAQDLAKECGRFGIQQQAAAIRSLFRAYATAEKLADDKRDEVLTALDPFLDPKAEKPPTAEEFATALSGIKGKLPK